MAKSQETFSKKEREKQRMRKQQDKKEKMEMRKSNKEKGKKLEDMMAYLDENGNLTDRPSDPRIKREFRQEDIQIGVPKMEDQPAAMFRTGIVAFFNDHKGFGFINDSDTRERVFVHVNDLTEPIKENDKVTYRPGKSPRGPIAQEVAILRS
ncbi:cold shock domain-containing protein [Paraflavitalea sp. CAU 1676]|uniref:cold-shock protein n=1 Tax=Paraflavitalea sp. CAU 1676 TaxID=3032598 RepID=UPI0023D9D972|nr:cold shock domain-containing protein [Paraflavitalea sp. CAU 1676]MDF2190604.1 cold shock domain-containing protein [Paraflavitalea sp. CAU 1676]